MDNAQLKEAGTIGLPFWPDECGHPAASYIGSFAIGKDERHDVYLFVDPSDDRPHVCVRFGPEGHDYHSGGELASFLDRPTTRQVPYMSIAAEMILRVTDQKHRAAHAGRVTNPGPVPAPSAIDVEDRKDFNERPPQHDADFQG